MTPGGTALSHDLPEDWTTVELGRVADLRLGRTPPRKEQKYWKNGTFPWVSIADLTNATVEVTKERVSEVALEDVFANRVASTGTLLLSFKLTIGKVGILTMPATHNEAIAAVIPRDQVDRDFLFFLLQTLDYDRYQDAYVKGATLSKKKLLALPIPLPPFAEQCAIAHVLRTVRRAREATEQVMDAARELKRSLMRHLFTYGPVPPAIAEGVRQVETGIGPVPAAWQLSDFDELVAVRRGQVDPRQHPFVDMMHIGPDNVEEGTGRLKSRRTAREIGLISGKYLFDSRDVLYSKIRPYLRKAIVPDSAGICSADMYPLRPIDERLDREYLFQYLLSDKFTRQAVSHQSRTGIPKINRRQLGQIALPLPDVATQRSIVAYLSAVDGKFSAEEARREALQVLFDSLLHSLMTGRVRVPIEKLALED